MLQMEQAELNSVQVKHNVRVEQHCRVRLDSVNHQMQRLKLLFEVCKGVTLRPEPSLYLRH